MKVAIGIDPGVNTGIAIWNIYEQKFVRIATVKIHQAITMVNEMHDNRQFEIKIVRVEDARQVRFGTDKFKAQGAGSIKRDSGIWEDFLTDIQVPFIFTRPDKSITKYTPETFKRITGHSERTSSHARDAAMLIYKLV